jgi:hypothetical protein
LSLECAERDNPSDPRVKEAERRGLPEVALEISSNLGDDRIDPVLLLASRTMEVQTDGSNIQ